MTMSGLSFLDELALAPNSISADADFVIPGRDEDKLFDLFFGPETGLGFQSSDEFPELAALTEPSDAADESAAPADLAPPPLPSGSKRRSQTQNSSGRGLKPATQSQEKSRCGEASTREQQHYSVQTRIALSRTR